MVDVDHRPVAVGIVGMGGYARSVLDLLGQASPLSDAHPVRVVAACDPDSRAREQGRAEAEAAGAAVLADMSDLLAMPEVEAVWLPVPIDLHRPFTEQALAAGKAVMCEKPAAGCVQDVDAMIAARDRAGLPAIVGFQDIYHPATLALKRRLIGGAIGTVREAVLWAAWPRGDRYYQRASWAGAIRRDNTWVLDSPVNNALAHHVNLALFLLGSARDQSAAIEIVDAELYRARDIENYDTASLRLTLSGGAKLLVLLTHACGRTVEPTLRIRGDVGSAQWQTGRPVEIEDRYGQCVEMLGDRERPHTHMVERFARLVRGLEDRQRAVATLETARAHVAAVNAASAVALVSDVPATAVEVVESPTGPVRAIAGIEQVFELCAASGQMLHECGRCAWAGPASRLTIPGGHYERFEGPAARAAAGGPVMD